MTNRFFGALTVALAPFFLGAAAAAPPKVGAHFTDFPGAPEMVVLPAGSFLMGATPAEQEAEKVPQEFRPWHEPQHKVTFARPFAVGVTEVTYGQYRQFVAETGKVPQSGCNVWNFAANKWDVPRDKGWQNPGYEQTDAHPVVCVDWDEAKAYVDWLAAKTGKPYHLLSEAQFEYAARGGKPSRRFWGSALANACRYANVADTDANAQFDKAGMPKPKWPLFPCRDGSLYAAPVKSFRPNPYGLYDIIGNAVEWTADCSHDSYKGAPTDGSAWTTGSDCKAHLERGGSWIAPPWVASSNRRHWTVHDVRMNLMTLRVALDL